MFKCEFRDLFKVQVQVRVWILARFNMYRPLEGEVVRSKRNLAKPEEFVDDDVCTKEVRSRTSAVYTSSR